MTFTDWYLSWLDQAEHEDLAVDNTNLDSPWQSTTNRQGFLTLLFLIIAGVLLGLILKLLQAA